MDPLLVSLAYVYGRGVVPGVELGVELGGTVPGLVDDGGTVPGFCGIVLSGVMLPGVESGAPGVVVLGVVLGAVVFGTCDGAVVFGTSDG